MLTRSRTSLFLTNASRLLHDPPDLLGSNNSETSGPIFSIKLFSKLASVSKAERHRKPTRTGRTIPRSRAEVSMRRAMIWKACMSSLLIAIVLLAQSPGQHRRGYPSPPGPAVPSVDSTRETKTYKHLDTLAVEREARELSTLAATIPNEVEQIKKELLPK